MNNEFINYYDKLDLPKDGKYEEGFFKGYYISIDGIQNAMERLKRKFGMNSYEVRRAQEAYNVLTDPVKRAEYNAKLEEYLKSSKTVAADSNERTSEEPKVTPEEPEVAPEEAEITPEEPKVTPEEPEVAPKEPEVAPEEPKVKLEEPKVKLEEPEVVQKELDIATKKSNSIKNIDEETLEKDAIIKAANRKRIINNSLIIGGSTLFFGPIGTIAAIAILKKKGKLKLQKLASKGKIKEIKTAESELIAHENEKLEKNIDQLLNSPLKDNQSRYKLELAKLRYERQVDLLSQRIKFKKLEKSKLGGKAYNRLYVLALEKKFAVAIKSLEVRKKIAEAKLNALNSYEPNKEKEDRLTKIQKEIFDTKQKLEDKTISNYQKNHKTAKLNRLNTKRLQKINKMSLKKNGISRNQVVLALFNSAKNKVSNLFKRENEVKEENIDLNSFSGPVR